MHRSKKGEQERHCSSTNISSGIASSQHGSLSGMGVGIFTLIDILILSTVPARELFDKLTVGIKEKFRLVNLNRRGKECMCSQCGETRKFFSLFYFFSLGKTNKEEEQRSNGTIYLGINIPLSTHSLIQRVVLLYT
jgi:hypothetical protein